MSNVEQQYGWSDTELTEANYLLIPEILKQLPGSGLKILDLGCGNGTLASALHAEGHQVTAVDASADGIELARQRFPGVRFETCSVYDDDFLEIVGKDFDVVVSMEVIEHLYWPRKLIEKASYLLIPGGKFIVTTPYHGYLKNLAISVMGGWDNHFTVDWDGGHIKFFSRKTLAGFMQDAGFRSIDFFGEGRMPWLWKSMILTGIK